MNTTRQVTVITFLSFTMFTIGNGYKTGKFSLPEAQQLAAWGLLYIILLTLTDIPATGEIAQAFAWLILLTILLTYGVDAFEKFNDWVSSQSNDTGATGGRGKKKG